MTRTTNKGKRDRLEGSVDATLPLDDLTGFKRAIAQAGKWDVTPRERRALTRYRVSSRATSAALFDPTKAASARTVRRIELLDSALIKAPVLSDPLTVYRGERHPRTDLRDGYNTRSRWGEYEQVPQDHDGLLDWAHARWPSGTKVTFPGYASFSATTAVAMRFTAYEESRPPILFRTQTRHFSHPGLAGALNPYREYEVILPRASEATVEGVSLERIQRLPMMWGRPSGQNHRPKALSAFVLVDLILDEPAASPWAGRLHQG